MVNYGVSRACKTCKERRKKCDETRPVCSNVHESCDRCRRSKRVCPGYGDASAFVFRHYGWTGTVDAPVRLATPPPTLLHNEPLVCTPPSNLDKARLLPLDQDALEVFFRDYCIESLDRSLSRGFLDGIQPLIASAGESSDVAQAAQTIALAGLGNRMKRPDLISRAETIYSKVLRSFHTSLSRPSKAHCLESLMTAVLLGLFEIIVHDEGRHAQHPLHARGVAAILSRADSPFDLAGGIELFQLCNPLLLKRPTESSTNCGVLCIPSTNGHVQSLDAILIRFNPIHCRANALLSELPASTPGEEIRKVMQDAMDLEQEFREWAANQTDLWQPTTIGQVDIRHGEFPFGGTGNVDSYFDFYVAAVWNTYRKTHIMILDLIFRCQNTLADHVPHQPLRRKAEELANGIAATIPFFLSRDAAACLRASSREHKKLDLGRPIGGLLLLHPLWVVSVTSIITADMRTQMRQCLAYIGENMGIRQAILLSDVSSTILMSMAGLFDATTSLMRTSPFNILRKVMF